MTRQQRADLELALWQQNRELTPEQRMEILMWDYMLPPAITEIEYELQQQRFMEAFNG